MAIQPKTNENKPVDFQDLSRQLGGENNTLSSTNISGNLTSDISGGLGNLWEKLKQFFAKLGSAMGFGGSSESRPSSSGIQTGQNNQTSPAGTLGTAPAPAPQQPQPAVAGTDPNPNARVTAVTADPRGAVATVEVSSPAPSPAVPQAAPEQDASYEAGEAAPQTVVVTGRRSSAPVQSYRAAPAYAADQPRYLDPQAARFMNRVTGGFINEQLRDMDPSMRRVLRPEIQQIRDAAIVRPGYDGGAYGQQSRWERPGEMRSVWEENAGRGYAGRGPDFGILNRPSVYSQGSIGVYGQGQDQPNIAQRLIGAAVGRELSQHESPLMKLLR